MSVTDTRNTTAGPTEHATADDVGSLYRHLRVVDVADALDGIGYFDIGLLDRELRPLWSGMKFWGPAATIRAVPSNRPMWKLDNTQDIVDGATDGKLRPIEGKATNRIVVSRNTANTAKLVLVSTTHGLCVRCVVDGALSMDDLRDVGRGGTWCKISTTW